jgi:O-antigen/teichoic acid export membrane protein
MIFDRIRSLAKHTAVYGVGDILGKAVGVLLVPLYARMLSTQENGVISLAFAFVGFSAVLYSLGLNPALIRFLSGETESVDRRDRFSTAYWTLMGVGCLLSTVIWFSSATLAAIFLDSGAESYTDVFHLIAVIVLLDTLSEPLFTVCRARQRSGLYAIVRFAQHSIQLGFTIYLIAGLGYGVRAIFWTNVASSAFALLVLLPMGLKQLRLVFKIPHLRELLAFGIPFVPSTIALLVINLSDRFLLKFFLGLESVGTFTVVYKICLPMLLIVRVFRAAWAPAILAISDRSESLAVVRRVTTYFTMCSAFLFLLVSTFGRDFILLIAGEESPKYLPAEDIIPLITLAFLFSGIYIILTAGVYVEGRSRALPIVVGCGAVVNICLNLILIPRIGLVGAAWSTLVAYGIMSLLLFLFTRRFYPVQYEYGRLLKIGVAALVVQVGVSNYLEDSTPGGVITRLIILLVFPLILWGWRFFDPREWADLMSIFTYSKRK